MGVEHLGRRGRQLGRLGLLETEDIGPAAIEEALDRRQARPQ
jgi:hypothetical protein